MAVTSTSTKDRYTLTGATTDFTFNSKIFIKADLVVIREDTAGVETILTITNDYTINPGPWPTGGTVTTVVNYADGTLTIKAVLPQTQLYDYVTAGKFPANSHEFNLDRLVLLVQALEEKFERAVLSKASAALLNLVMPVPVINNHIGWNSTATALENKVPTETSTPYIGTLLDDDDAEEARGTLRAVGEYDTIAALRLATAGGGIVRTQGHTNKGVGGLVFWWDTDSTANDNNGTIIKLATVATGRYLALYVDPITDAMFGSIGDGVADDTSSCNDAGALGVQILLMGTSYNLTGTVTGKFYHLKTAKLSYPGSNKFEDLGIYQPSSNQGFSQNGAIVNRFGDKLLVGNAINSDSKFPNVLKDWLTIFQEDAGLGAGTILAAQMASLNSDSAGVSIGGLFAGQSLNVTSASASSFGVSGYAVNNNTTLATGVWAGYFESHRVESGTGGCRGIEVDIRTLSVEVDPFPAGQSTSSVLQLGAGAGLSATGQQNVGAAIQIVNNPMKFRKGIVFLKDSLEGTDGNVGAAVALALATLQNISWYNNANGLCGLITCTNLLTTTQPEIRMSANGVELIGAGGNPMFLAAYVASAVNYIKAIPSATGNAVDLAAIGTDTNIDLNLTPKGTGEVVASKTVVAPDFRSQTFTIADDAAASFTPANAFGTLYISNNSGLAARNAIVSFKNSIPRCEGLTLGGSIEVTTGALTGTDGTDVKITISAHTDGKIYIENRIGGGTDVTVMVI